jgi:hypothetical protein
VDGEYVIRTAPIRLGSISTVAEGPDWPGERVWPAVPVGRPRVGAGDGRVAGFGPLFAEVPNADRRASPRRERKDIPETLPSAGEEGLRGDDDRQQPIEPAPFSGVELSGETAGPLCNDDGMPATDRVPRLATPHAVVPSASRFPEPVPGLRS